MYGPVEAIVAAGGVVGEDVSFEQIIPTRLEARSTVLRMPSVERGKHKQLLLLVVVVGDDVDVDDVVGDG